MPAVGAPGSFAVMTAPDAQPGFEAIVPPGSPGVTRWPRASCCASRLPSCARPSVACPLLVCVCEPTRPPRRRCDQDGRCAPRGEVLRYPVGHFEIYWRAVRAGRRRPDGLPAAPPGPGRLLAAAVR
jgi:hypothetical protein